MRVLLLYEGTDLVQWTENERSANSAEEGNKNVHDTLKSVKPWVTFAGGVLIVAVLYWAQAVLVPFRFANHSRPVSGKSNPCGVAA